MVGQLLSNTNEMLQCILALQNLDLNTALIFLLPPVRAPETSQIRFSPCLVPKFNIQIPLCKKEIPHHIKMPAHTWITKCR
jgi:hypothetical protein